MSLVAVIVVGVALAACSSSPSAGKASSTVVASTTTLAGQTSSTPAVAANGTPCAQVFAKMETISVHDLRPYTGQVARSCSPADLKAVVNQRVEATADGQPLNAIGQAVVTSGVALVTRTVCPSHPHTALCP